MPIKQLIIYQAQKKIGNDLKSLILIPSTLVFQTITVKFCYF